MKDKLKGALIAVGVIAVLATGGAAIAGATGGGGGDREDHGSDKAITGSALDRAGQVALKETGAGKVTETEQGDEESYYEVEVTLSDGRQVDVQLDESFAVVSSDADRGESGGEGD